MAYHDFIRPLHQATKRDYLQRIVGVDKAECATIAKQFGFDYFDGDRQHGYGGYQYDGRWLPFAETLVHHYGLKPGDRVLDIGCGKGFLLHDFMQALPGVEVAGLDISRYAVENSMPEVKPFIHEGNAISLPYPERSFDLVLAINVIHNLQLSGLELSLREIERVSRGGKYIVMDSYRNEREKFNLMCWQLTCECFFTQLEWEWVFQKCSYTGDYGLIYFE